MENTPKESVALSLKEEFANSVTHGIGVFVSLFAIALLVPYAVFKGSALHVLSVAMFGGSMLILYTASTLYHSVQHAEIKPLLRLFDHMSIYILIAGSYTPFLLMSIGGVTGWVVFGLVWGFALLGVIFKAVFQHRFDKLSLALYLGMGWIAIFIIKPFIASVPVVSMCLVVGGGLSYTLGTIFYARDKPYDHTIWHLFVLKGSITHSIAVFFVLYYC